MSQFRLFEAEALKLIGSAALGSDLVDAVIRDAEFVSFDWSSAGYFLTVSHTLLPKQRMVLDQPIVEASTNEASGTYLAFIENNQLLLEFAAFTEIPENFRDLEVRIDVQRTAAG